MAVDMSDPAIMEAYTEVRKAGEVDWMTIEYADSKRKGFKLSQKGTGGVAACLATLPENAVRFGYIRVEYHQDAEGEVGNRTKFVFFSWTPEKTPVMEKAKVTVHTPAVRDIIRDASIAIQASDAIELSVEEINKKLSKSNY
eukprot:TRINITY_DN18362_c0_g1_i1.p1 TRINITY_DN18362_c0_g1~~TRINITY_DN18362_c0_g1_i1.p1  ORF type:complete len:162 (-),score=50.26 TRINITY_DN18362_c0_g1_i1:174-599(-)